MVTIGVADKSPARSQRRRLDAVGTFLGEGAGVRVAVLGRANARWSRSARWILGIFTVAFVVGLVVLHAVLFPGGLVLLGLLESVIPRRCLAVTATGVADLRLGFVRGQPASVVAVTHHAALFDSRLEGVRRGKSVVPFGIETVSVRTKDLALLRAGALAAAETVAREGVVPLPPPPPPGPDARGHATVPRADRDAAWAGIVALAAAILRAIAYFLPWIVLHTTPDITAHASAVGAPVLSIGCSLAAIAIALVYLAKRNAKNAQLLAGVGMIAAVAAVFSIVLVFEKIRETGSILNLPGLRLDVTPGVGPWIQAVGSIGILLGGMWAARITRRRTRKVRTKPLAAPSTPAP